MDVSDGSDGSRSPPRERRGSGHAPRRGSGDLRSGPDGPADGSREVFVGGLNFDTDERAVRERFERHGEVASVRILYDRDTRRSRGVAFVAFADAAAAEEAAEKENGREIDGRRVRCNLASRKPESPPWGGGGRDRHPLDRGHRDDDRDRRDRVRREPRGLRSDRWDPSDDRERGGGRRGRDRSRERDGERFRAARDGDARGRRGGFSRAPRRRSPARCDLRLISLRTRE